MVDLEVSGSGLVFTWILGVLGEVPNGRTFMNLGVRINVVSGIGGALTKCMS